MNENKLDGYLTLLNFLSKYFTDQKWRKISLEKKELFFDFFSTISYKQINVLKLLSNVDHNEKNVTKAI